MATLHIFNPEHDIMLPYSQGAFTPSKGVKEMKRKNILLPALYAAHGDFIMIPEDCKDLDLSISEFFPLIARKKLRIITNRIDKSEELDAINPWGWDFAIVDQLRRRGVRDDLLPSIEILNTIKNLSHRSTSILFHRYFREKADFPTAEIPHQFFTADAAYEWGKLHPNCYFKSPWSSSGYGVFKFLDYNDSSFLKRISNVISLQGSIMGEENYPHRLDMATEWISGISGAEFLGFSLFKTGNGGQYRGNVKGTQEEIERTIEKELPVSTEKILTLQKGAIENIISPHYNGPLGIDMLVSNDGRVNMCVEVNLRMTMGHVELLRSE